MTQNLSQFLQRQWSASEVYFLQSPETAFSYLLTALDLQAQDSIICDPLLPPSWLAEFKNRKIQVLFIDLKTVHDSIDLDLLEDFLSLSTLINEKEELIYRKDQLPIKAIFNHTAWKNQADLQRFLFIAKRYYLKVVAHTASNDLLNPSAQQSSNGDLIQGAIQVQGQQAEVLLTTKTKSNPLLSGFGRPLQQIEPPQEEEINSAVASMAPPLISSEIKPLGNMGTIKTANYYPSFAQILHPDKKTVQTLLMTKGFVCIEPFPERLEDLKSHTFLSRTKAGLQYLEQVLWVSIPNQTVQKELLATLQLYVE
jgi:hypothetical protein